MSEENQTNSEASSLNTEQNAQYERIALQMIKIITRSMPSIVPTLAIKGKDIKVNNKVNMPLLSDYEGSIIPSYIIIKGEKERTLYFCVMKELLFNAIKELLVNNYELRDLLTKQTIKMQFACPDVGLGLYFTRKSQGLFKGKKTHIYQFNLTDKDDEKD